jgi:hypothetical protein
VVKNTQKQHQVEFGTQALRQVLDGDVDVLHSQISDGSNCFEMLLGITLGPIPYEMVGCDHLCGIALLRVKRKIALEGADIEDLQPREVARQTQMVQFSLGRIPALKYGSVRKSKGVEPTAGRIAKRLTSLLPAGTHPQGFIKSVLDHDRLRHAHAVRRQTNRRERPLSRDVGVDGLGAYSRRMSLSMTVFPSHPFMPH